MGDYDVIVVGAGNAALAAAVSASNEGAAKLLILEKAPRRERGGNTYYSGGLLRFAFDDVQDLVRLAPGVVEVPGFMDEIHPYPKDAFWDDLLRVTGGRADRQAAEILISNSYDTVCWMVEQGIEMEPSLTLGAVQVGDVIKWPKGAVIRSVHEGVGLSERWFEIAEAKGAEIRYESGAVKLLQEAKGRVAGVRVRGPDGAYDVAGKAVVLGCGGFEANMGWRAQYLGKPWDHARVRGTSHNQGDGLRMALEIGAMPWGQWSGRHSTPINALAPAYGDRALTDKTNRLSYPYGVLLNKRGLRFVDEGEDQSFYTYAKYGARILDEPEGVAYQVFDSKVTHLLEPRYSTSEPIKADTLEALVEQLDIDRPTAIKTLNDYNAAAGQGTFDPGELDGMCTEGLTPPKSNWAQRLDAPPFLVYPVTGGITFTFGGLKVNDRAQVIGTDWRPIPGLYACGEMVGGLFHENYPGGSGLVSGATFGRIAGRSAARG